MADFPPAGLAYKEDSKYRQDTQKDPAMRQEMDGGYVITRPRYTRRPRRVFTTGFTDISTAEKDSLVSFYDTKRGGSQSFTWADPVSGTVYSVRFKEPMTFVYAGHGPTQRWNVTGVVLEEV